jgi:hypothetical protein
VRRDPVFTLHPCAPPISMRETLIKSPFKAGWVAQVAQEAHFPLRCPAGYAVTRTAHVP